MLNRAHICKEHAICSAKHTHSRNTEDRPFSGLDSNERLLLHLIVFNFSSDPICSMFFSVLTRTAAFSKSNEQIYFN